MDSARANHRRRRQGVGNLLVFVGWGIYASRPKAKKNPGRAGVPHDGKTANLSCQALVCLAARIESIGAEAADLVLFVIFEIAFEPFDMAVTFKG